MKITNASGIHSSTLESLEDWIKAGVDGVVLKTATFESREGYESPNVAIDGDKTLQAIGLQNSGYKEMDKITKDLKGRYPEIFFIVSFTTGDRNELIEMVKYNEKHADALEYNISCPHAKGLGSAIGYDFELLEDLCRTAKKYCNKPLGLKMPYYPTDELLEKCINASECMDFYTNINSVGKAMMLGENFGISNKLGGLSGPAMKPLAIGQVYRTRKLTDKFISGCGGIVNRKDVAEFLKAGANGVQLGSGIKKYNSKKAFVEEAKKGFEHKLKNYFENQNKEAWE